MKALIYSDMQSRVSCCGKGVGYTLLFDHWSREWFIGIIGYIIEITSMGDTL